MLKIAEVAALSFFILVSVAPATAQTRRGGEVDPDTKRICKRAAETGSFVKGKRVCLTRKQWNEAATRSQALGREMQTLVSTERGN